MSGDIVRVESTRIVHVRTGRRVPRIEAGCATLSWGSLREHATLTASLRGIVDQAQMETKLKLSSEVERPGATINLMLDVDPDSRHFGIDTAGRTYHRRDRARRAFALHVPGTDQIVKTANAIQSTIATGAKHLVHAGGDTSTTTSEGHDGVRFVNIRRDTIPPDEHGFLARLALKLERRVYAPKEALVPEDLQIVIKGVVGQNGNILRQGAVFGLDMIVTSEKLRDLRPITCISYVETAALTRADLDEIAEDCPHCGIFLRRAAMLLALERVLPHVAAKRAARAVPFVGLTPNRGMLTPKVRERWTEAMKYSMNISKDPPAVRRQDKFAKKEEERMLRFCARVSGQPGLRVVAKGDLNAFESGRSEVVRLEESKAKGDEDKSVDARLERLAAEMQEVKELLKAMSRNGAATSSAAAAMSVDEPSAPVSDPAPAADEPSAPVFNAPLPRAPGPA